MADEWCQGRGEENEEKNNANKEDRRGRINVKICRI